MKLKSLAAAALMLVATATAPRAELSEVTIAQQFGVAFLPLMLMERDGLVEKHAKTAGLDMNKLMADLKDPEIARELAGTHALAQRIKLTGTPLFIVNGKVHSGELTEAELKALSAS